MTAAEKRIGRYQVEEILGSGAFATVYRAVDERLDDTVAVKVLAENHSINLEIRQRFLTEGKALRRIDSPHVIRVHDLGETEAQQPFLVLEHADRGTLTERVRDLRENGWLATAEDVLTVAEPLARALGTVHRADLVHRDLSPGNVLLTSRTAAGGDATSPLVREDEKLLLADLGLVKDLALNSGFTSAGGTEGFRAPELRSGPARIDGRADLWSLSALIVWLVTGAPPGDGPTDAALAGSDLPVGAAGALARGLAHDPADRHPDAAAWLAEVTAALAPHQADDGTVTVRPPGAELPPTVVEPAQLTPATSPESYARTVLDTGDEMEGAPIGESARTIVDPRPGPDDDSAAASSPSTADPATSDPARTPPGTEAGDPEAAPGATPDASTRPNTSTDRSATASPDGTNSAPDIPTADPACVAVPGTATGEAPPADQGAVGPAEGTSTSYGRASTWQPPSQPSSGRQAGPATASGNPSAPDGTQAAAAHAPRAPAFGRPAGYSTPNDAAAPAGGYRAPGYATAPAAGHAAPGLPTATGASYGASGYAVAPASGYAVSGYAAAPPGRSGAWGASAPLPGWSWRLRHSLWLLSTLPFGLTTWGGFLYIGVRARRTLWIVAGCVYLAAFIGVFVILGTAPVDENGEIPLDSWQANAGTALFLLIWLGGIVHGLISNIGWLRWRADRPAQGSPY